MSFVVSSRQSLAYLKDKLEIKMNYVDIDRIRDFITDEWTFQGELVIYIPNQTPIDWELLKTYRQMLKIILAVENPADIVNARNQGFDVFWSYPISSFQELRSFLAAGVSQVLLDAPLYFDLRAVKKICGDAQIRIVVNKCLNDYSFLPNGIQGTYVRPEDIQSYSEYVDHFEFDSKTLAQERTLYKVYAEEQKWPGNLELLLTHLNYSVDNRGFDALDPGNFAERRMNCQQVCQRDANKCRFCAITFKLINNIDKFTNSIS